MPKKNETKQDKSLGLQDITKTRLTIELIGKSELILCQKSRSFELPEVFKQSHPKGTEIPKEYMQEYNLWEKLITSIHWRDPITYHDDDWSQYTEEEWNYLMNNNAPCIPSQAIFASIYEAFVSFGYKDRTGKNGTDIKRSVSFVKPYFPITFAGVRAERKLVPNNTKQRTNVLAQYNVFSGWRCVVELSAADVAFPVETLISLFRTAGEFCGVSTQSKNGYGHFELGEISQVIFD